MEHVNDALKYISQALDLLKEYEPQNRAKEILLLEQALEKLINSK